MLTQTKMNDQDFAFIANRMQVPMIIGDILAGRARFTDQVQYGLHEVLSDFQPDSALIAIALSAKILVASQKPSTAGSRLLAMEAERMIQDYGSLWIQNSRKTINDPERLYDVYVYLADDLESLDSLLNVFEVGLGKKDAVVSKFCKILRTQAKSQAMIAQAFMEIAENYVLPSAVETKFEASDNVIPFPLHSKFAQVSV